MRVLVTGSGGLLGGRLAELLSPHFAVIAGRHENPCPPGIPEVFVDLLSAYSMEKALDEAHPEVIIHSAAFANADLCEKEPKLAECINVEGTKILAKRAHARGIRVILLSTDLVFDGKHPFVPETGKPRPLMVYARTKHLAEESLLTHASNSVVLRVALVYGRGHGHRGTASETIAWSLQARQPLKLFKDQYRTPIDPESIATALCSLILSSQRGFFHLGGPERLSRYDLGLRVAHTLNLPQNLIEGVAQAQHNIGALRPLDVSLNSSRAMRELGWHPRALDEAIRESRLLRDRES